MGYTDWQDKTAEFKQIDVRGVQGNFFQGLKRQAVQVPAGGGLEVVQSFDPIPLYEVMEGLGFEHHTEQTGDAEFHAYFYRTVVREDKDIPMRPAALTNMPLIDEKLGNVAVGFWDLTWNDEHRYLPYETRLLLSLTNAVGAGRMRQATRELLEGRGLAFDTEPSKGPSGTWQMWAHDPDGNMFEVMQFTEDSYQVVGHIDE